MSFLRKDIERRYPTLMRLKRSLSGAKFSEIDVRESVRELKRLFVELLSLSQDSVMEVASWRVWFRELSSRLSDLIPSMSSWDTDSLDDLRKKLDAVSFPCAFHVVIGDVAFLSLVNHVGGHKGGDAFLRKIGRALRALDSATSLSGRLGGDEVGIFFVGAPPETVEVNCSAFENSVAQMRITAMGTSLGGRIDLGVAEVNEAISVFKEHVAALGEEGGALPKGGRVSVFVNTLVAIADRRSDIAKTYERIRILVSLYETAPVAYRELISFLRKGGGNISDAEVTELVAQKKWDSELFRSSVASIALRSKPVDNPLDAMIEKAALRPFLKTFHSQ